MTEKPCLVFKRRKGSARCADCVATYAAHEKRRAEARAAERAASNPGDPFAPRKLTLAEVDRRPPPPAPRPLSGVPMAPRPKKRKGERAPGFIFVDARNVQPVESRDSAGMWG